MPFCYYFHATFFQFQTHCDHILRLYFYFAWCLCALCVSCAALQMRGERYLAWVAVLFRLAHCSNRRNKAMDNKRNNCAHFVALGTVLMQHCCELIVSRCCIFFFSLYTIFVVIMKHFEFISSYVAVKLRDAQIENPSLSLPICQAMCAGCIVSLFHVANRCSSFARMSVDTFWAIFSLCDVQSKMKINTKQARENRY